MHSTNEKPRFKFTEWYQRNGEELNRQRRTRYHTDLEYKQRVLETNRRSRLNRRLRDEVGS